MRKLATRTVLAAAAISAAAALGLAMLPPPVLAYLAELWFNRPPDATPPAPTIQVSAGPVPAGPIGLGEWVRPAGAESRAVGSGFLLQLANGTVIGVTTAHSISDYLAGDEKLAEIVFRTPGQETDLAVSTGFYGKPGRPRTGMNLTDDYLLLELTAPVDPVLALFADTRGQPQPGERVWLASGWGNEQGGRRLIGGTVQSVDTAGVWVLMDAMEAPDGMSGSPVLSAYTGRVVGMVIAKLSRGSRFLVGVNPIGSILAAAAQHQPQPFSNPPQPR